MLDLARAYCKIRELSSSIARTKRTRTTFSKNDLLFFSANIIFSPKAESFVNIREANKALQACVALYNHYNEDYTHRIFVQVEYREEKTGLNAYDFCFGFYCHSTHEIHVRVDTGEIMCKTLFHELFHHRDRVFEKKIREELGDRYESSEIYELVEDKNDVLADMSFAELVRAIYFK